MGRNGRRNVLRAHIPTHGLTAASVDRRTVGVVFSHITFLSLSLSPRFVAGWWVATTTTTNQTIDSVWLCACVCAFPYVNACPARACVSVYAWASEYVCRVRVWRVFACACAWTVPCIYFVYTSYIYIIYIVYTYLRPVHIYLYKYM